MTDSEKSKDTAVGAVRDSGLILCYKETNSSVPPSLFYILFLSGFRSGEESISFHVPDIP
jgi:hypothetical protein